jgi:hypothetical protein
MARTLPANHPAPHRTSPRKEAGRGGIDIGAFSACRRGGISGAFAQNCGLPSPLPASLRGEMLWGGRRK